MNTPQGIFLVNPLKLQRKKHRPFSMAQPPKKTDQLQIRFPVPIPCPFSVKRSASGSGEPYRQSLLHVRKRPKIQRSDRPIRGIALSAAFKPLPRQLPIPIEQRHTPPDAQIAPTEHVRAAQRKNHKHFRRPYANAVEGRKLPEQFLIGGMAQGLQIQSTGSGLAGDTLNIPHLTLAEATLLDL